MVRRRARSQQTQLRTGRSRIARTRSAAAVRRPSIGVRPSSTCDYCAGPIYSGVEHEHPERAV